MLWSLCTLNYCIVIAVFISALNCYYCNANVVLKKMNELIWQIFLFFRWQCEDKATFIIAIVLNAIPTSVLGVVSL